MSETTAFSIEVPLPGESSVAEDARAYRDQVRDLAGGVEEAAGATAADREQTGQDREATQADRIAVEGAKDTVVNSAESVRLDSEATAGNRLAAQEAAEAATGAAATTQANATATADDRAATQLLRDATGEDRTAVEADRTQVAADRVVSEQARAEAETYSGVAVTAGTGAANSAAQADIARGQAEAAFAVAAGGTAGFLQKAGGFIFATTFFATTGLPMVAGITLQGELVAYNAATQSYFAVGNPSGAAITAALGFTPASAASVDSVAVAAGNTGFAQKAGGYILARIVHDKSTGRILSGQDIFASTVSWDNNTSAYSPLTPMTAPAVTAALGYTPANAATVAGIAAAAGTTGFAQRAGDLILMRVQFAVAGNLILGGADIFGRTIAYLDGSYVVTGAGQGAVVANPAPGYVRLPASPTISQFLRGTHIRMPNRVMMIIGWGQSLILGGNGVPYDQTFTTTALNPGWSLMFDQGPWPERGTVNSIVDLRNPANDEPRGGIGRTGTIETYGPRMFDVMQKRLLADTGTQQRMLWSVAGAGGAPYYTMKRGTPVYAEMLRLVEQAAALAKSQFNAQLYVAGIFVAHGEADGFAPPERYGADMVRFRQDAEEDVREITGQRDPVRLLMTQPVRGSAVAPLDPGTPNGMLVAADRDPYCVVLGGKLHSRWDNAYDGVHPLAIGYAHIAETYGHALGDLLYGRGFEPTRIQSAWWATPTLLQLQYTRPVVLDASGASLPVEGVVNFGYEVVQRTTKNGSSAAGSSLSVTNVAAVPSDVSVAVVGNVVTLGGISSRIPWGGSVKVGAATYDVQVGINDSINDAALALAQRIPGAISDGASVTIPPGESITASIASSLVNITVAAAPTLMPRLAYGVRGKGLVRGFETLGLSAIPGNPPLHHWAVVELRDVPLN